MPPPGIRRHGAGWQVRVSVAGVGRSTKQFALEESFDRMVEWQEDERYALRKETRTRDPFVGAKRGTFADDARRYLDAVAALSTIEERRRDIALWVAEFGPRRRASITAAEIRAVRDRWLTVGPKMVYRKPTRDLPGLWEARPLPLSGSTVNHRLRALSNLWTVLDGRRAPNPVRDVPEADETPELPRDLPYDLIQRILDALPDRGRGLRHQKRATVSLTKLRLRVMAWTGLAHKQLTALKREHVDLEAGTLLTWRKKGKGVEPERLPLLPEAVEALRAFFAAGAEGPFHASSMRQSFLRAVAKVEPLPGVRPYDLRHSFGARVYRVTGNLQVVAELLRQTDLRTTRRYALAAVNPVLTAALAHWRDTPHAGPGAGPAPSEKSGKPEEKSGEERKTKAGSDGSKSP